MRRSQLKKPIASTGAALAALAVLTASSTAAGSNHVTIAGSGFASYQFKPGKVTIAKGQKVHWSWSSNAPHNVTFQKLGKHSKTGAAETYSLRFKKPGTYRYVCTVHGFKGKVVVTKQPPTRGVVPQTPP